MKTALDDLVRILHSDHISNAAKTTVRGFTQPRKITLQDVLLFYTFRHGETTNKDIISYFSKVEKPKVSKQAMFKALGKTNPELKVLQAALSENSAGAAGSYLLIDPINRLSFFYTMHVRLTRASWEIAPVIQEEMYRAVL